jgi:hypothetical protein
MASGYTLCFAAKWLGEEETYFSSIYESTDRQMVEKAYKFLSEADAIIHFNGTKFDIPTLNKEFLLHGITPPPPSKNIDLLKVCRSQFRFPSNKLDYVCRILGLGGKVKHIGHDLWTKCMEGDAVAWEQMKTYNIEDVALLERLYYRLLPWIKSHPNRGVYKDKELSHTCPVCASTSYQKRGYSHTSISKYQRYRCNGCGHWYRDNKNLIEAKLKMISI